MVDTELAKLDRKLKISNNSLKQTRNKKEEIRPKNKMSQKIDLKLGFSSLSLASNTVYESKNKRKAKTKLKVSILNT